MGFLRLNGITKRFGGHEVLRNIDLSVDKGGFLVLVGPSGCGKSTLLNIIAGLEDPSSGTISLAGREIDTLLPSQRDMAMVFQSYALYPTMNVAQNLGFGLEMRKVPKRDRDRAIAKVAKLLQIETLLERKPGQLSGGQRQRVAMGRALVREPQLFLFDEPLSNLDAKLRVDMRVEIKRLHQRLGTTMVYVTHDQVEALTLATRIAVLNGGVLQQVGTPEEIYDKPANTFVAQFMGSPSMNLLEASVDRSGGRLTLQIGAGDQAANVQIVDAGLTGILRDSGLDKVIAGVRPEDFRLAGVGGRSIRCTADVVELAGADRFIVTRIAGREVTIRIAADTKVAEAETLNVELHQPKLNLFDPETGLRLQAPSS